MKPWSAYRIGILLSALLFITCEKDPYVCDTCVAVPEALPANDASGRGIYKGIVLGSTGTLKIDVANRDNTISAVLRIDGKRYDLYPFENEGIYKDGYCGELSGNMFAEHDIILSVCVNGSGTYYKVEAITIPTHEDVYIHVVKEFSMGLIEAFEGTFSGDASGNFNLLVLRDEHGNGFWRAASKDTEGHRGFYEGSIHSGTMEGDGKISNVESINIGGSLVGDGVRGNWENTLDEISGTWNGRRTL